MKLQAIELANFLSHGETRFEPNGARLMSIVGANGAGKSSLLDGVLYALYDAARAKTDQLVRLGQTDMSATVTFSYNGATYRIARGRTTKAGGKTYLELAIQDGDSWRPLTGEDIRSTQASIDRLLGLDATTFTTAAFLRQGEADQFIASSPADRKRVLSQVLGLEIYQVAEARARDMARDVDARVAADRAQAERLEDEVAAGREGLEAELGHARTELEVKVAELTAAAGRRDTVAERIRELEATIAATKAIADQVAGLEREKAAAGEAWHRARDRAQAARLEVKRLEAVLLGEIDVAEAVAALPGKQVDLERLMKLQDEDRAAIAAVEAKRRELEGAIRAHDRDVAVHDGQLAAARARVAEYERGVAGLEPVICEKCKHPNVVDQADLRGHLAEARSEVLALEAGAPSEPTSLAFEKAKLERLEVRRREAGFEPAQLIAVQSEVTRLTGIAARAETIAAAKASIERERMAITEAEAEQARITERGEGLKAEIAELLPKIAGKAEAEAAWSSARNEAVAVGNQITVLEASRRQLERAIAGAEVHLEALAGKAVEALGIRQRLAGDETEARRLRREVQAFGVAGIPARIIEGVLPELASYANELLADLRPGMTLELRAQRAKKDGKGLVEALDLVVRDPVGERPLALFSGGERMSVSLALAVGLSRLVARRAGARIELLAVDEPDGLDAAARRSFGQALRVIAHRGELAQVVLVSHHEDLAEFADEIYQVTKGPNGSVVELVA